MRLFGIVITVFVINFHFSESKLFLEDKNSNGQRFTIVASNIINECLGLREGWSELMIIPDLVESHAMVETAYRHSNTANFILFVHNEESDDPSKTHIEWHMNRPRAFLIFANNFEHLEILLNVLKKDNPEVWRPGSYFLIILEMLCNPKECNEMFKLIWDNWILNAIILCSSNDDEDNGIQSEIELYTFNPYSAGHSQQWETIINETIVVSIPQRDFNHSWYIFNRKFTGLGELGGCDDLFFDKTSNLDNYVIPMSYDELRLAMDIEYSSLYSTPINNMFLTIAERLRFDIIQGSNQTPVDYGHFFPNGTYSGMLDDVCKSRSNLVATKRGIQVHPGIEMTYPHDMSGPCFMSVIGGNRPQWTNLAGAKNIWICIGFGIILSTVFLYAQNRSYGIVSAFLDAERMIFGSSIVRQINDIEHRMILGSFFIVILVIDGAIRGRFIAILTIGRPYPNLDSIEQLKEIDIDIFGHSILAMLIADDEIRERINDSIHEPDCLESLKIDGRRDRVCFGECKTLESYALNSTNLHKSSIPAFAFPVTFYTTLHWPMRERYSLEVQKLIETGIVGKWESETRRRYEIISWKIKRGSESPYVRATELNDILPALFLLLLGLFAALIIFLWEYKKRQDSS